MLNSTFPLQVGDLRFTGRIVVNSERAIDVRIAGFHKHVTKRNGFLASTGAVDTYKHWIPSANRDAVNRLPTLVPALDLTKTAAD